MRSTNSVVGVLGQGRIKPSVGLRRGVHAAHGPAHGTPTHCLVGVTWSFCVPYLLAMCAEFDKAGRMAALGSFASKMGLASDPMAAALGVGKDNHALVGYIGTAALLACLVAAYLPARTLDRDG